jgi:hypothetical protein
MMHLTCRRDAAPDEFDLNPKEGIYTVIFITPLATK